MAGLRERGRKTGGKGQVPGQCNLDSGCRSERVPPLLIAPKIRSLDNVPGSFLRADLLYGHTY